MYAIIETGGKQYWVKPGEVLHVNRLQAEPGAELNFKPLWAAATDGEEAPADKTAVNVKATVVKHLRGPKIIVYRKKTKKAYEKASGHRQELTEIKVEAIA